MSDFAPWVPTADAQNPFKRLPFRPAMSNSATATDLRQPGNGDCANNNDKKRGVDDSELRMLEHMPTKVRRMAFELETARKELAAAQAQSTMKDAVIEVLVGQLRGTSGGAPPVAVAPPTPSAAADTSFPPHCRHPVEEVVTLSSDQASAVSRKNMNMQIRPDPPIPHTADTGPFNQSVLKLLPGKVDVAAAAVSIAEERGYTAPQPVARKSTKPAVVASPAPAKPHHNNIHKAKASAAAAAPVPGAAKVTQPQPAAIGLTTTAAPKPLRLQLPPVVLPPEEEEEEAIEDEPEEEAAATAEDDGVEDELEEEEEEAVAEEEEEDMEYIQVVHHSKKPPMGFFFAPATGFLYRVATDADGDSVAGELVAKYDPVAKKILERYAVI